MKCILCSGVDFRQIYADGKLAVSQCVTCGLVRQENGVAAVSTQDNAYSTIEQYYQTRGLANHERDIKFDLARVNVTTDIQQELQNRLQPGQQILDVGCGQGEFAYSLSTLKFAVSGVEPDPQLASYVETHLGIPCLASMYKRDSFAENSFDAITFIQVVEHLENPLDTLSTAHMHLRPGGLLVVDVPGFHNPRILFYRLTGWKKPVRRDFIPPHIYYYSADTLTKLVEKVNFRVVKVRTGRYSVKFAQKAGPGLGVVLRAIDAVANFLRIGGVTLYAVKA